VETVHLSDNYMPSGLRNYMLANWVQGIISMASSISISLTAIVNLQSFGFVTPSSAIYRIYDSGSLKFKY